MKILLLTRYNQLGASSRVRILQFLPRFERAGFKCTISPLINDKQLLEYYESGRYSFLNRLKIYVNRIHQLLKLKTFDLVWIEKEALPWLPARIEIWLLKGVPYVLDYDDATFHSYDSHPLFWVRHFMGQRIDYLMAGSRLVIAGNYYLAQRANAAGASWVEIIPTVIDLNSYIPKTMTRQPIDQVIRIVWIGSPYTMKFLRLLQRPLEILSRSYHFKFRVIAGSCPELPGVDLEFVPWSEDTESTSIRDCDIGVMPLTDTDWEKGKCGYKLIQYMACSLPVVASSIGANCDIVRENIDGFLVKTDSDWVSALSELLESDILRKEMGGSGRKRVEGKYCVQKIEPKLVSLLSRAAS